MVALGQKLGPLVDDLARLEDLHFFLMAQEVAIGAHVGSFEVLRGSLDQAEVDCVGEWVGLSRIGIAARALVPVEFRAILVPERGLLLRLGLGMRARAVERDHWPVCWVPDSHHRVANLLEHSHSRSC